MKYILLLTLTMVPFFSSQVNEEEGGSCKQIGRSISSLSDGQEESYATICRQERTIISLKDDLDKLQKDSDRLMSLLDRLENVDDEEEEKTGKTSEVKAPLVHLNWSSLPVAPQFWKPTPIIKTYSPFHNRTTQDNAKYLNLVMAQRLHFQMNENNMWHPEYDQRGNLTNPIYGDSTTWQRIENMYKFPTQPVFPTNLVY